MDRTFLIAFFDVLNRQFNYAVLRGAEGLPEKNSGRDIDILADLTIHSDTGGTTPFKNLQLNSGSVFLEPLSW